jgi:hypothetical protein
MTTLRQAAQQALAKIQAAQKCHPAAVQTLVEEAEEALLQALEAEQQDEPSERPFSGLPLVIAGAIFDFAGFLTTRPNTIEVGSTANAAPMADLVKEWAELRGLSLDDAAVLSWQELLHTRPQPRQPLTPEAVNDLWIKHARSGAYIHAFARAIERAHGITGETK